MFYTQAVNTFYTAHTRRKLRLLSAILPAATFLFFSYSQNTQAQTTLGVGTGIMPKYEGAKKYKAQIYPLFNYEKDNFFIGPKVEMPSVGFKVHLADNWQVGVFGSYVAGRKARKDDHLYGMRDIRQHAAAGVFSTIHSGDFSFDVTYFHALKDGYGGGVQVGGAYRLIQTENAAFRVGGIVSWADNDAMDTYFGVTESESKASGGRLQAYKASSGLRSMAVYGAYHYQFSPSWSFISSLGVKRLTSDAADSPITQRKSSLYGGVGLGYSF